MKRFFHMPKLRYPGLIVTIALCIAPLIPLWYYEFPPLQDYGNHFARLNILLNYEHAAFYKKFFSLVHFNLTAPLTHTYIWLDLFVRILTPFMDINNAMKTFISLYVVLYIAGIYMLARQQKKDFMLLLLINLPLIYSSFFYFGFLDFLFSIPVFLFTLWAIDRYIMNRNALNFILMLFLIFSVYISHIFTFTVLCIILFCRIFTQKLKTKEYIAITAIISLFLILNLDFLGNILRGMALSEPFYLKLLFLTHPFVHFPLNLIIIVFTFFAISLFLILRKSPINNKLYLIVAAVLLLIYLIFPFKRQFGDIDVRALLFAMILLPFSFNIRESRHSNLARVILLSVSIMNLLWIFYFFSDFNKNFSTKCAGEIKQGSIILPIDTIESNSATVRPYHSSWGYFLKNKEFLTPYLFTGSHIGIEYKNRPPAPNEWWVTIGNLAEGAAFMHSVKDTYDYILIFGNNPEVEDMIGTFSHEVCSDRSVRLFKIEK